MKEKISALLDDELSKREREEALKTVSKDKEFSDLWHRYNLIGAAFRREINTHSPGLVQRVAQLISHEQPDKSKSRLPVSMGRSSQWTWSSTVAIAASIMAVVAVGVYMLNQDTVTLDVNNQSSSVAIIDNATRWENATPEHEDQLNALLVEHGEFTPMAGLNGLISYAKFVSYDAKE
jgi:sigma-E factor negative regulatory protein RseA